MLTTVYIVDAFVDGQQGGNPAGVVLDADGLTTHQKAAIAKSVNLSETAFVSKSDVATLKVEFFTPTRQIPHCGHATLATFALCRLLGKLQDGEYLKESVDGLLSLGVAGQVVTLRQAFPSFATLDTDGALKHRVLDSLGIDDRHITPGATPIIARSGNAFLLVPVKEPTLLQAVRPNLELVSAICAELDLIGFYPYSMVTSRTDRTATTRMFAPRYGIPEESATGTAAGPLGAYLLSNDPQLSCCLIEQGCYMVPASPSLLSVSLAMGPGQGQRLVHVSGSARWRSTVGVDAGLPSP